MGIWFDSTWFGDGSGGGGGGGGTTIVGSFATYADLPDATLNTDNFAYVQTSTGIYLINRKQKGYYRSDGATWVKAELDEEALDALTNHLSQYDHASIADKIKKIQNVVYVQTNPDASQFSSIKDAVDSITTNSSSNPFVIQIGPGVYVEDTIPLKPYISLLGAGPERTFIQVDSSSKDAMQIQGNNIIVSGVTISGASDSGKAGVSYTGSVAGTSIYFDNVRFNNNYIHFLNKPNGVTFVVTLNNATIGSGSFTNGFVAQQTNSGTSTIFIRNSAFLSFNPITNLALADGANTNILSTGVNFRSVSTGNALAAQDGGRLQLVATSIAGWTNGIYMPNVGSSTAIIAHGMNFDANTADIRVEHTSASGVVEGPVDISKILINDSCTVFIPFRNPRILTVGKRGADFTTITAALAFITDNSSSKTYFIDVAPGIYIEDTITMKPYVYLRGSGHEATVLQVDTPTKKVIVGSDHSAVISCGITGATGSGGIGVYHSGSSTFTPFLVRDCYFQNNETCAKAEGLAGLTILQIDLCRMGGLTNFTTGFVCRNQFNIPTQLVITNTIFQDVTNPGCTTFIDCSGPGTAIVADNVLARNYPAAGTKFLTCQNGAEIRLLALTINGFDQAIHVANSGAAPALYCQAINISDSISYDINVLHTGAVGNFFGTYKVDKIHIDPSSTFFIAGKDLNIITVAKRGGDFLSIAAACDWVTDADPDTNPYLILVGPGTFAEPEINLKSGISIRGSSIQTTIVNPDAANHNIFNLDRTCELSFLTISGAGSGYVAIMCDDVGDFAQLHKISMYDNDTHIKVRSVTKDTYLYLEYVDINGTFVNGLYVESTNGFLARANIENWYTFNGVGNSGNDVFLTGTNAIVESQVSVLEGSGLNTGFRLENGAIFRANSTKVENADIAVYLPNIGTATVLQIHGIQTVNSTTHNFQIDHPGANGFVAGSADVTKISANASSTVKFNIVDNDSTSSIGLTVVGDIYQGSRVGEIQNVSLLARETFSAGLIDVSSVLSQGTNPLDVDVAAGTGFVEGSDGKEYIVTWIATTLTVPDNSKYYVTVNSAGTLQLESSFPVIPTRRVMLGFVVSLGGQLVFISNSAERGDHTANHTSLKDRAVNGAQFASGSIVTENGSTPGAIDVTPGEYYYGMRQFLPAGMTAGSFRGLYQDGLGGTTLGSVLNTVPSGFYDDGSGTLAAVPSNRYVKHVLVLCGDGAEEIYSLIYGQTTYVQLQDAIDGLLPTYPSFVEETVTPIAAIVMQQGSSNIHDIASLRRLSGFVGGAGAAVTDHGALTGLADNDHPQYLLRDGSNPMTANLDLGGFTLTNVGSALPGTTTAAAVSQIPDQANAEGVSSDKARADHVHNIPTATPVTIGTSNQQGTASSFARSDHVHNHGNLGGGSTHSAATTSVNGFMSAADKTKLDLVSSTELGYVAGVTSAIQTQLNSKAASGANTDITSVLLNQTGLVVKGATAFGLIIKPNETLTANHTLNIIVGDADRTLTIAGTASISGTHTGTSSGTNTGDQTITLTGDVTGTGTSSFAATITTNAVTNAKLAQVATATIKGRITALTGNVEDLTTTQVTSMLNAFTGDTGTGGVKGLVPAPASGDATKFLRGDGTWADNASGSVTTVSVVNTNGFFGSVANASSTPAITITTTVTGILKGNGTAISAATAGTDYSVGTSALATGILKSTTGTGTLSIASAGTDYEVPLTFSTGLTRSTNTITVNTSQNIAKLTNLTSNGIVTTSGGDGTLSVTSTTGSGNVVLATSPTLVTPVLGVASATSINKVAITAPATSATLTIADGKTLTASNSITLSGTDSTVMTFPSTNATVARTDAGQTFTGTQVFSSTISGSINGNAGTATTLQTARNINGISFNGSADITIAAAAGTLTGTTLAAGVTASSLTSFGSSPTLSTPTITGGSLRGATVTGITSLGIRSSGTGNFDVTIANTENLTAARTLTIVLNDLSRTLTIAGTASISGTISVTAGKTLSSANTLSFSGTDGSTVAFGTGGTVLYVGPRVQAVTSSATVTPNADTNDLVVITAQAVGLTIANPTGTPVQGQKLTIRLKDNGGAQSIAFGAQYRALGNSLPTTTTASKTMYMGFIFNSTDTRWDLVALTTEA